MSIPDGARHHWASVHIGYTCQNLNIAPHESSSTLMLYSGLKLSLVETMDALKTLPLDHPQLEHLEPAKMAMCS